RPPHRRTPLHQAVTADLDATEAEATWNVLLAVVADAGPDCGVVLPVDAVELLEDRVCSLQGLLSGCRLVAVEPEHREPVLAHSRLAAQAPGAERGVDVVRLERRAAASTVLDDERRDAHVSVRASRFNFMRLKGAFPRTGMRGFLSWIAGFRVVNCGVLGE